jgi:outer membrane protein OmpA-like peptidoglycan-associated protein
MKQILILACALAVGALGACASMESGSGKSDTMAKKADAPKKKKKKKKPASGSPFTVYFKQNSSVLTDKSQGSMFDIMQKVRSHKPKTVHIVTHTDLTGSAAANKKMSEKRAANLAGKMKGAGAKSITTEAVGDTQPLVDVKGPSAANRRGIIIFKKK